eukprot:7678378-Alexandrium_andersonii.AAC.1
MACLASNPPCQLGMSRMPKTYARSVRPARPPQPWPTWPGCPQHDQERPRAGQSVLARPA